MGHRDQSIEEFLDAIASETVSPAGGSAAAVVAAFGAALCEMALAHALGGDGADDRGEASAAREVLRSRRDRLLDLAERDAAVVDDVFGASAGPVDEAGMKRALGVPLSIAETGLDVIDQGPTVLRAANPNAAADVWTGIHLEHAALEAAAYTARTNLALLPESEFTERTEDRIATIEAEAAATIEQLSFGPDER